MILGWTVLHGSVRERRSRIAAAALLAACTCCLAAAGLLLDPRHPALVWSAAAVSAIALAAVIPAVRLRAPSVEVAVAADGSIRLRPTAGPAGDAVQVARCAFVAPWLITLRCGTMWVPVWPDSAPADAFRRLHACARWVGSPNPRSADARSENHDSEG